jgi:hypothetical protein
MTFMRAVCPPSPLMIACFLGPRLSVYNWSFFVFDTVFYAALGYATIFGIHVVTGELIQRKILHLPKSRVGPRVSDETWIGIFILSVIAITLLIVYLLMTAPPKIYTQ